MNIFAIEGNNNKIDWSKSAKSQDNYRVVKMILESTQMLCSTLEEYTERFGKIHKCSYVLEKCIDLYEPSLFPLQQPTRLPLAMPPEFKSDSIVESYRKFYASKPRMRYPRNKIPEWFIEYRGQKAYDII